MRNERKLLRRLQHLSALSVSALVLYAVTVTVGSSTPAAALEAFQRDETVLAMLRWELGDFGSDSPLSFSSAMALSAAPSLLSAKDEVLSLWSKGAETESENAEQDSEGTLLQEETTQRQPLHFTDNGVPARTLTPSSDKGYDVIGSAYISNTTGCAIDPAAFDGSFAAGLGGEGPQVLIVHTHGSEAYTMPAGEEYESSGENRTLDNNYNVVRVGEEIAAVLAEYGIATVHDRSLYDYPQYNGAYGRSLEGIESYLEKYPSVSFVLDIHRDAITDAQGQIYKVISETEEGGAAQLTLVMGSDGSGLSHSGWRENLKLAVAVQQRLLEKHPTLMRPILLRNSRYNQHATAGSLLVEVGAAGNSLDEALLAARLFAEGFAETIGGEK
ncbi:MAG: stage II sporulation protein P [Oscillospiraceae bacterium]|nr:stage II sporulation protein P [Oscillospiraceae bacterium]